MKSWPADDTTRGLRRKPGFLEKYRILGSRVRLHNFYQNTFTPRGTPSAARSADLDVFPTFLDEKTIPTTKNKGIESQIFCPCRPRRESLSPLDFRLLPVARQLSVLPVLCTVARVARTRARVTDQVQVNRCKKCHRIDPRSQFTYDLHIGNRGIWEIDVFFQV